MVNNDLLPVKKENSFFGKIKTLFNSIFRKRTTPSDEQNTIEIDNSDNKSRFIEDLKEKTNIDDSINKQALEYMVSYIEIYPELLNNFNIEDLEKINEYYDKKIEKIDKEINKLKG